MEKQQFENVTFYTVGMFGVHAMTCKTLEVVTGVKYAQYNNAIQLIYLEKGKRTKRIRTIAESKPWLRIVNSADAINPADPLSQQENGARMSRYASCDPRYTTEFEDALTAAGGPVLVSVGEGERTKCMRCVERIATTEESGSLVCGPCANAIRCEEGRA